MTRESLEHCKQLLRTDKVLNELATDIVDIGALHNLPLEAYDYTLATLYSNYDPNNNIEQYRNDMYCKVNQGIEAMISFYSLKVK